MKTYIANTLAAVGLIIFFFGMESSAQTANRIVADVPFDFFVRNEKLSAGRYEFESATPQAAPGAVIVRYFEGTERRSMIVPAMANSPRRDGSMGLVFNRYGSTHYLSGVAIDSVDGGLKLVKTSREKELAREFQRSVPVTVSPIVTAANKKR